MSIIMMSSFMPSNRSMEIFFTIGLFTLMFFLLYEIYELINGTKDITAPLLIGVSALTASFAMSRSVYATKISDDNKATRELLTIRLEHYVEVRRILTLTNEEHFFTPQNYDIVKRIHISSSFIFDTEIESYLSSMILLMKPFLEQEESPVKMEETGSTLTLEAFVNNIELTFAKYLELK